MPGKGEVSWHFTVDDEFVYQSLPTTEIGWHTATARGKNSSIGVEICMNPELDVAAAYDRAALLTAWLAYRFKFIIPANVVQHNSWSGKNCPRVLREKANGWSDFLAQAKAYLKDMEPVEANTIRSSKDDHLSPDS